MIRLRSDWRSERSGFAILKDPGRDALPRVLSRAIASGQIVALCASPTPGRAAARPYRDPGKHLGSSCMGRQYFPQ